MKKLLICFVCIFFCGCTVNYNITIDDKMNISENITIEYNKSKIDNGMTLLEFSKNREEAYSSQLRKYGFSAEYKIENDTLFITLNRSNSNLKMIKSTYEFQKMYNSINRYKSENGFIIKTDGDYAGMELFNNDNEFGNMFNVDELNINIKFYNKIVKTNADSCNNEINTCTWKYNKNTTRKTLEIELSDEVLDKYKKPQNNKNHNVNEKEKENNSSSISTIGLVFGFILVVIVGGMFIFIKNQKNNKL